MNKLKVKYVAWALAIFLTAPSQAIFKPTILQNPRNIAEITAGVGLSQLFLWKTVNFYPKKPIDHTKNVGSFVGAIWLGYRAVLAVRENLPVDASAHECVTFLTPGALGLTAACFLWNKGNNQFSRNRNPRISPDNSRRATAVLVGLTVGLGLHRALQRK